MNPNNPLSRYTSLAYGVGCYLVFFGVFLYAIGFIGNFAVPKTIDGAATLSWPMALAIDLGLLTLFALQHSVMARPAFKRAWCRFVSRQVERSTYVLFSSLALAVLFAGWQPLGGEIWAVSSPTGSNLLYAGYAAGWLLVLASTCLINHFDLFGLRQVWLHFRGQPYTELAFVMPWPYRVVRHPLYVGWLAVFWFAPTMTVTHLLFAVVTTGYILVGIQFEERDLEAAHPAYRDYKREVPMLVPRLRNRASGEPQPALDNAS